MSRVPSSLTSLYRRVNYKNSNVSLMKPDTMKIGLRATPSNSDAASSNQSDAFNIVFGKPSAPRELYERIANESREKLLSLASGPHADFDLVLASLHVASEDDAIKTKTHIPLPVDSYSTRLDDLVKDCTRRMRDEGIDDPRSQLSYCSNYLYSYWGLKIASGMNDGAFSPYRVYMNLVITQRCGTPSSSAALLSAFILRLMRPGNALEGLTEEVSIGLPSEIGSLPIAVLKSEEDKQSSLVQFFTKRQLLADQLDSLKRFYWSWNWQLGQQSGFEACARSLLGESGRAGLVNAAVGVMQPTGRPFGNVELSVLATERAAHVTALIDQDGWDFATHVRDMGALNIHIGKKSLGLSQLESYKSWLEGEGPLSLDGSNLGGAERAAKEGKVSEKILAPGAYHSLVSEVILVQRRKLLESTFSGATEQSSTEFLPTDD